MYWIFNKKFHLQNTTYHENIIPILSAFKVKSDNILPRNILMLDLTGCKDHILQGCFWSIVCDF